MLYNYFKIAIRSLIRQKVYSAINILGLSVSLAVTFLMLLWIQDEWSTDKFHENGDRIYRVKRIVPQEGNAVAIWNGIPLPVLSTAVEDLPEVEKYIPLGFAREETLIHDEMQLRESGTFANEAYFESFSYPVLIGDISQLDKKINAIAMSESMAKKFFGNTWKSTALGETIEIHNTGIFSLEAVYADFPENSSLKNDFIYSFESFLKDNEWMRNWNNAGMQGALLLAKGAEKNAVEKKLTDLFKAQQDADRKTGILLQKHQDHYLYGEFDEYGKISGGRIEYIRIFSIAALFLLIISCINFVNMATARASKRAKEVGIRKTVGAAKKTLIGQFMVEAAFITCVSICMAFLLAIWLLPSVNSWTGKGLTFDPGNPIFWLGFVLIFIVTAVLAGAYPALVLSSYKPMNVLKGNTSQQVHGISLRKGLIVTQFVLAMLMIVGALVVQQQVDYLRNKNLGINKESLIVISKDEKTQEQYDVLKNELLESDAIAHVTSASSSPISIPGSTSGVVWPGKRPDQENQEFAILWVEHNLPEVLGLPIATGRFYRKELKQDSTTIVLNQTAINVMGLNDPIGQTIQWWGKPRQIIGVVEDFHTGSLYHKIGPTALLLDLDNTQAMFVKPASNQTDKALYDLQATFEQVIPDLPLHYEFVDDQYQALYKSETLTQILAKYFSIISIIISCLGLLGLTTFFAEQRTREIGIRKVLGASVTNLIALLSKEFILLVGMGLLVGLPISWYFTDGWLKNFEYRINPGWGLFTLAVAGIVLAAMFTVGVQAVKNALINPISALRNE